MARKDSAGHAETADGEAARHGRDDPEVVAPGGEGVGGDPVVQGFARVPGGRLVGDAHRRTSFPLISTTGRPPGTGHWTLSAGTTMATPVRTSL